MEYKKDYFGFVYIWLDTKRRKFIIGSHHGSIDDGYTTGTGGKHVQNIFKSRPETMRRRILAYNNVDCFRETRVLEQKFFNSRGDIASNPKYYNLCNNASGGIGGWDHINNDPDRVNPMLRPDVKQYHQQRMLELVRDNPHYFGGRWGDDNPMRNKEVMENHPALFTSENNPMNNPETRRRNKEIQTKLTGRPITVGGVHYPSLREGARQLQMSPQKLRHRLNSESFKDHYFSKESI